MRVAYKSVAQMTREEYNAVVAFAEDPDGAMKMAAASFRSPGVLTDAEKFALWYLGHEVGGVEYEVLHAGPRSEPGIDWPEWENLWGR